MKIYIGPYKNYFGPYQLAEKILFWKDKKDDVVFNFGRWLAGDVKRDETDDYETLFNSKEEPNKTLLYRFMLWIDSKKKRKVKIRIDNYDVWNMNSTLAMIILPMLKKLKESKHGSPCVDDEDVPEELRSTSAPPKKNEWDTDDNFFKRWDYVMDEMIWTFEQLQPEYDWEDQYHTGVTDLRTKKNDSGYFQMVEGPSHTHVFDKEGHQKHAERIDNGLRMFGKYYQGLWD